MQENSASEDGYINFGGSECVKVSSDRILHLVINTFDFENLFGSFSHKLIIEVLENIHTHFKYPINCEKKNYIHLIKFWIFKCFLTVKTIYFIPMEICFNWTAAVLPMESQWEQVFHVLLLYLYSSTTLKKITKEFYFSDISLI